MKRLLYFMVSLVIVFFAYADTIVKKDGSLMKGTITSVTKDSISLRTETELKSIARSEILSCIFSNADIVTVHGMKMACKILNKFDNDLLAVTTEGVKKIDNASIEDVQRNVGSELTVTELTESGPQFINEPSLAVWAGEKKASFFLRAQLAAHFASLDTWKSAFVVTSGEGSPSSGSAYGGEFGYAFSSILQVGAGYEVFATREVKIENTSPTFTTKASYSFLYGTVRAGDFWPSLPTLYIYGGVDLGSLKGTVSEAYSNGITIEGTGTTMAYRIKGGGEYFFDGNWSMSIELGYLIGKVDKISLLGQNIPGYDLDFSGASLIFVFSYHIPLP